MGEEDRFRKSDKRVSQGTESRIDEQPTQDAFLPVVKDEKSKQTSEPKAEQHLSIITQRVITDVEEILRQAATKPLDHIKTLVDAVIAKANEDIHAPREVKKSDIASAPQEVKLMINKRMTLSSGENIQILVSRERVIGGNCFFSYIAAIPRSDKSN